MNNQAKRGSLNRHDLIVDNALCCLVRKTERLDAPEDLDCA